MKEQIERMYIQALIDDLPPNVFADQVLRLFNVSDCYSELQMKDCFQAGVYYERSIVSYKEAKKQKGARIVMSNDTPNFSEFMHKLNNR